MKIILASLRFHYRNLHSSFCQLRQTYKTSIEIVFNFVNHNNFKKNIQYFKKSFSVLPSYASAYPCACPVISFAKPGTKRG